MLQQKQTSTATTENPGADTTIKARLTMPPFIFNETFPADFTLYGNEQELLLPKEWILGLEKAAIAIAYIEKKPESPGGAIRVNPVIRVMPVDDKVLASKSRHFGKFATVEAIPVQINNCKIKGIHDLVKRHFEPFGSGASLSLVGCLNYFEIIRTLDLRLDYEYIVSHGLLNLLE